jgi:23S rRNA pseudouridine1911/1915/1917 synthase
MADSWKRAVRKGEWLEFTLPAEFVAEPERFLLERIRIPRGLLNRWQAEQCIRRAGSRLRLRLFPCEAPQFAPEYWPVGILYEDDFCLVADKPAGMPVHPTHPGRTATLANAVAFHYQATGQMCRIRHIHRLDADTTGPVLYAKQEQAHAVLDEAMRNRRIGRTYIAVVSGRMKNRKGTIDLPIGKDRHHKGRRRVSATGDPAVTHYEVAERRDNATLVRLRLETGRTHQIRVHLSHIGHPIYGDALYGGPAGFIGRQALHCETLRFPHPWTGEMIEVASPWPDDLRTLAEKLFQHRRL